MSKKLIVVLLALCLTGCDNLFTLTPTSVLPTPEPTTPTAIPQPVVNPSFEQHCTPGVVHIIDGQYRDNICTPYGWVTWWRIGSGEGGDYGQPEVRLTYGFDPVQGWAAELPRLHSGEQGLQLFTMYRPHDAGLYALVSVPPGATVRVVAWAETWSCNNDDHLGYTCEVPWDQVQVAVCLGDTPNPLDATCSEWQTAADRWVRVGPVEHTVSESGVVVVFLRSWARWAFEHLDVYWDDVILVVE